MSSATFMTSQSHVPFFLETQMLVEIIEKVDEIVGQESRVVVGFINNVIVMERRENVTFPELATDVVVVGSTENVNFGFSIHFFRFHILAI